MIKDEYSYIISYHLIFLLKRYLDIILLMDVLEKIKGRVVQIKPPHIVLGIDPYIDKIPPCYTKRHSDFIRSIEEWANDVLFVCKDEVVGVKFQMAFFEFLGSDGVKLCLELMKRAKEEYDFLVILDAKRNDIPDVSQVYAQTYLNNKYIDALTTTPYFGLDSLDAFIKFAKTYRKLIFVVVYSSNKGAMDFQRIKTGDKEFWEEVLDRVHNVYSEERYLAFVVGATNPAAVRKVQDTFKSSWILSPGFGPQGADVPSWKRIYLKPISNVLFNLSRTLTVPDPVGHYTERRMYAEFIRKNVREWKGILRPLYEVL